MQPPHPQMVGYDEGRSNPQCYPQGQQSSYMKGCNQIIYYQQAPSTMGLQYENYKGRQSIYIGVSLIIIGIMCIAFSATSLGVGAAGFRHASYVYPGQGFWGGMLMVVTGSFGIGAGKCKSKCLIVAFMVHSIISALCALVITVLGIVDAVVFSDGLNCFNKTGRCQIHIVIFSMGILLAITGGVGLVLCIWGSIISRKAAMGCCYPTYSDTVAQTNEPSRAVYVTAPQPYGAQFPAYPGYSGQMVPNPPEILATQLHQPQVHTTSSYLNNTYNCDPWLSQQTKQDQSQNF